MKYAIYIIKLKETSLFIVAVFQIMFSFQAATLNSQLSPDSNHIFSWIIFKIVLKNVLNLEVMTQNSS